MAVFAVMGAYLAIGCGGSGSSKTQTNYAVGRTAIDLTDTSRTEKYGPTAGSKRKLALSIWYPASPAAGAKKGPFLTDAAAEGLAPSIGVSKAVLQGLPTNSYINAPMEASGTKFPVLIMSHGDGLPVLNYTTTAEYLAARGYVVVGVNHTYNANFTAFSDDTLLPGDPAASVTAVSPVLNESSPFADHDANFRNVTQLDIEQTADLTFVLDQLNTLNAENPKFRGRLRTDRIGALGHSFGGSHSFRLLQTDPRVVAAVNLDGTIWNRDYALGVNKPFMVLSSNRGTEADFAAVRTSYKALGMTDAQVETLMGYATSETKAYEASRPAYYVKLTKAAHSNFSDLGIWNSYGLPDDTASKEESPVTLLNTTNMYVAGFFDENLLGRYAAVLHQPAPSGVEFKSRN